MALINTCGAFGGFIGTWVIGWLQAITGNSRAGFFTMSMSLLVAAGIILCLRTVRPVSGR
jgi:MFS-type transporter involved in bile tolerance (Atg22 family)